jgi:hypothetical protein
VFGFINLQFRNLCSRRLLVVEHCPGAHFKAIIPFVLASFTDCLFDIPPDFDFRDVGAGIKALMEKVKNWENEGKRSAIYVTDDLLIWDF